MKKIILMVTIVMVITLIFPLANADSTPDWVKNTAGWWSTDAISETEFVNAIEFLVNAGIIQVNASQSNENTQGVPDWVKNTAGWWATDAISETEFVNAIEFLVNAGIIQTESESKCVKDILKFFNDKQEITDICEQHESNITELIPYKNNLSFNSHGFRGVEFSSEKPSDVYRIFMVGGSTMLGAETTNDTTIPSIVQKMFDEKNLDFKIEVINAGVGGGNTISELALIKSKIINYNPDLIIMYDGWNDISADYTVNDTISKWAQVCGLGNENNFDVIIALQPIAGFGDKILTEQETEFSKNGIDYENNLLLNSYEEYQKYTKNLENLDNCQMSVNLRGVFDDESAPIYWDQGHVSDKGNNLIAKSLQEKIIQLLPENLPQSIQNKQDNEIKNLQTETQIHHLIANYKTPIMINKIFSLENIVKDIGDEQKKIIFETQSKIYNDDEISIIIEVLRDNDNKTKVLEIKTINHTTGFNIPNVTYFLKIIKDNEIILSDFFYVEEEIFVLEVSTNNLEEIKIFGDRQYAHSAIIADYNQPIKISGPILENDEKYEFVIELRTMYDTSDWIFSLSDFHAEVTP